MTSISDGEGGLSVRTKLNDSLAVTDAFSVKWLALVAEIKMRYPYPA